MSQVLVKRCAYVNVQPYYVYVHDLVKGVEELRTTVETAAMLEKSVRGTTAGVNTPTFVVDAPGGGGKRGVGLQMLGTLWSQTACMITVGPPFLEQ